MAIPKFYTVLDIAGIPVAQRDIHGTYFLKTAGGFKLYRVEDTPARDFIELEGPPEGSFAELMAATNTDKKLQSSKDLNDWLQAQNILPPNNNIVIEDGMNTIIDVNPTLGNTFVAYGIDNLMKLADPTEHMNADVVVLNRTKGEVLFDGDYPENMLYVSTYDRLYPPYDPVNQPTGDISGLVLKAVSDYAGSAYWLVVSEIRIMNT